MKPDPQVIDELIQRIVQTVQPLRIILFGSAARDEMKPNSDLDLLVVVPDGTAQRRTARSIYCQMIGFSFPVDVVVATGNDLRLYGENKSLVYHPALKEGKEIYAIKSFHSR